MSLLDYSKIPLIWNYLISWKFMLPCMASNLLEVLGWTLLHKISINSHHKQFCHGQVSTILLWWWRKNTTQSISLHYLLNNFTLVIGIYHVVPFMTNPCRWKVYQNNQGLLPTQDDIHQHWASKTNTRHLHISKVCAHILEKLYSKSWGKATQAVWRH